MSKMNRYLALLAVVMAAVSGYGSQVHAGNFSQFTVPKATKLARARMQAKLAKTGKNATSFGSRAHGKAQTQKQTQPGGKAKAATANTQSSSSPTSLGLVSATQIPAGGTPYNGGDFEATQYDQGYLGDFNGDGKMDVLSVEEKGLGVGEGFTDVYYFSTVLSNGNGTFQSPVLTPSVNYFQSDPLLIADVNGDGKDDVIQVHFGLIPSTIDVWLSNGDGTFKQGNTYQVSPTELAAGIMTDVNGDGKMDLVAIDTGSPGLVRTLLGNGDGTFQSATSVTLATQAPYDIVFADFNGDGKPDFAGLNNSDQVVIYLQEGGNYIQTSSPLTNPDSVYSVCGLAAGDLTGDGAAEVVTMNCDSPDENTITVYVNNGSGTFSQGVYYNEINSGGTTPANPFGFAATIADVNGDGKNDIVLAACSGGDEVILLGNGDGTVKVPTVGYATGGFPTTAPLVADFNGDGLADIMQLDNNYSYAYLKGYGDGTFRASLDYYGPISDGSWPSSYAIASGDFNGDGVADFVVGTGGSEGSAITVYLSRGDGSLLPGVNYAAGYYMGGVAVADFNGDGKLDIAATYSPCCGGQVQILNGNGDGTFTIGSSYPVGNDTCAGQVVVGDFNHDGHPDLAVANDYCDATGSNVGVLLNDGTGSFNAVVNYSIDTPDDLYTLATGDFNGDGYLDLILPGNDYLLYYVLLGNADNSGTFQNPTDNPLCNGPACYFDGYGVTLGDFNGDGKIDFAIAVQYYPSEGIAVALGNGDGTFQTPNLYSSTSQDYVDFDDPYPGFIQNADVNGDGILDLVYTNDDYGTVGILLGNGDGSFGLPNEYPAGSNAEGLAVADVNGDGALDVVVASDNSDSVAVLLNANGSVEKPDFTATATAASATVKAGSSATYDLTATGKNGYESAISFTCSGLPSKAKCSFSPATVTTAGNDPQATVLTISTTAATTTTTTAALLPAGANSKSNSGSRPLLASLSALGLFGFVLAAGGKNRARGQAAILLGVMLVGMSLTLVGCSGVSTPASSGTTTVTVPGTPAGTYTVTVTSTGKGTGAPSHSMKLTLVVE
jgi:hypothetical protein